MQHQRNSTGVAPGATLIVVDATGSSWGTFAVRFHDAGYVVSVVTPVPVVKYAKALPRRSKTDARAADLLTPFAWERVPPAWTPPPHVYHELRQRFALGAPARAALLELRGSPLGEARNHRHALLQWPVHMAAVKDQRDAISVDFDARITLLEREIAELLQQGAWAESAVLLPTIKSVGPLTAAWVLVFTLNFEPCATPAAAAAYAGLAPLVRESGRSVRGKPRVGPGGNKRLRTVLDVATLNAARFKPVIRTFYERLVAQQRHERELRQLNRRAATLGFTLTPTVPVEPDATPSHVEAGFLGSILFACAVLRNSLWL